MNPKRWQRIGETFASLGMINKDLSLDGFLYDPGSARNLRWLLRWVGLLLVAGAAILAYQAHRSNAKFRAIFNAANDAIFIHDMASGAILGMASAHIEAHAVGSPIHRAFETFSQAATRGGMGVKSLLRFAHQTPTEVRQLDLNELLREEIRLLERTTLSKVKLELDLAADLWPIRGEVRHHAPSAHHEA
jgi:hypothetical protein